MALNMTHHDGRDAGPVTLYALSTCVWCRKTKALLQQMGVSFDHVDVDTLQGDERAEAMKEVARWNPARSFPVLVIDNKDAIIGFDETRINEELGGSAPQ
jgi:glutaredoxin-like protein NrdH